MRAGDFGIYRKIGAPSNPWDDLQGSVAEGNAAAALTVDAYRDTSFLISCMRHDQQDALNFSYQMPHRWQPGSEVRPHLHVVPLADPAAAQVVRFAGEYAWAAVGEAIPAASGWTAFTADFTVAPGDVFRHRVTAPFSAAAPETARESAVLLVRVYRDGTNNADTFTTSKTGGTAAANLGILSADVHIMCEKDGTEDEFPAA